MKVAGATVLLTGASSGIGAALAPMLAERGATVGILARRSDRLAEVLDLCNRFPGGHRMWVCDLTDPDAAGHAALEAERVTGGIDILVNNAAAPKRRYVDLLTSAEVEETMRVNFVSPVRMTLALLPAMLERDRGSIVNVSSMGGRVGILQEAAYCASKFALCGWSESMAADLWGTGVEVRLINPGPVDTEIWDQPDNDTAHYTGPMESPATVAEAVVAAIEGDSFETYVPDLKAIVEWKTSNIDQFIEGVAAQR